MNRWDARAANPRAPLWSRVVSYAEANVGTNGHCPLKPEQLHHAIDPTLAKKNISRAIAQAIDYGWLHPSSCARCLVVVGRARDWTPCRAVHKKARA